MKPALSTYENTTKTLQEEYRPLYLMNLDAKVFSKIQHIETAVYKKGLYPDMTKWNLFQDGKV